MRGLAAAPAPRLGATNEKANSEAYLSAGLIVVDLRQGKTG
jgi:hypothetical protein